MQIQPREYFVIARGLEDPSDSTTYYMQATIRNARTDALIDTVNLTDNGNRRFTKAWQAPADPNGDGFYILVTIGVYTDAAYTVRADNYGDSFTEYLIQQRPTVAQMGGGAGGPDIDYAKIQKIIDAAVGDITIPAAPKPISLAGVEKQLSDIALGLSQIDIPEQQETNLAPVVQSIADLKKELTAAIVALPKFEKTDLSLVISTLSKIQASIDNMDPSSEKAELEGILERIRTFFNADLENISSEIKSVKEFLDKMPYVVLSPQNNDQTPTP